MANPRVVQEAKPSSSLLEAASHDPLIPILTVALALFLCKHTKEMLAMVFIQSIRSSPLSAHPHFFLLCRPPTLLPPSPRPCYRCESPLPSCSLYYQQQLSPKQLLAATSPPPKFNKPGPELPSSRTRSVRPSRLASVRFSFSLLSLAPLRHVCRASS
jgi:hypothetical protein